MVTIEMYECDGVIVSGLFLDGEVIQVKVDPESLRCDDEESK